MRLNQFFQCFLLEFGVSVVLQFCVCAGDDTQTYIMSEKCGSVLDMAERHLTALHLRLTDLPTYRPHMSCSLVLRAPPQHQLLMVVQRLDIDAGRFAGACTDFFSAWDGEFGNRTTYVEGLNDKICGQGAPAPVTSKGRSVTLYFDSNSVEEGSGFSLLFTAFRHGNCTDEDFRCDNGRCIDKRLKCDDDDNCGDDSDICLVSVTTAALVLIIITVVGCIVFAIVFLYWQRDRLLGRKKSADIADVSQPTESTTASTAP